MSSSEPRLWNGFAQEHEDGGEALGVVSKRLQVGQKPLREHFLQSELHQHLALEQAIPKQDAPEELERSFQSVGRERLRQGDAGGRLLGPHGNAGLIQLAVSLVPDRQQQLLQGLPALLRVPEMFEEAGHDRLDGLRLLPVRDLPAIRDHKSQPGEENLLEQRGHQGFLGIAAPAAAAAVHSAIRFQRLKPSQASERSLGSLAGSLGIPLNELRAHKGGEELRKGLWNVRLEVGGPAPDLEVLQPPLDEFYGAELLVRVVKCGAGELKELLEPL